MLANAVAVAVVTVAVVVGVAYLPLPSVFVYNEFLLTVVAADKAEDGARVELKLVCESLIG